MKSQYASQPLGVGDRIEIEAGRLALRCGRIPQKREASASAPLDGTFF